MNSFTTSIHSFVSLITNSSSEVFVAADRQTIAGVTDIINAILRAGGSEKRCEDLFNITLCVKDGGYGEHKALHVWPKGEESGEAAELLDELNNLFMVDRVGND